MKVALI